MTSGENDTYILGPEVGEKPEVLTLVKSFEDNFNDKLRKKEKERAAQAELERLNGGSDRTGRGPLPRRGVLPALPQGRVRPVEDHQALARVADAGGREEGRQRRSASAAT